jgi:flagellin-specific chaperone FliS
MIFTHPTKRTHTQLYNKHLSSFGVFRRSMDNLKLKRKETLKNHGGMLICVAITLNQKLDGDKKLTITKVSSRLYKWIFHACREDDI